MDALANLNEKTRAGSRLVELLSGTTFAPHLAADLAADEAPQRILVLVDRPDRAHFLADIFEESGDPAYDRGPSALRFERPDGALVTFRTIGSGVHGSRFDHILVEPPKKRTKAARHKNSLWLQFVLQTRAGPDAAIVFVTNPKSDRGMFRALASESPALKPATVESA